LKDSSEHERAILKTVLEKTMGERAAKLYGFGERQRQRQRQTVVSYREEK
jgi:hypothetical protein